MKKIFFLIVVILFSSCLGENYKYEKHFLKTYVGGKSAISYDLTDHFPNELKAEKKLTIKYPVGAPSYGMANMIFSHQVDSNEFNKVVEKLKFNNTRSYKPTDSIFIIIGDSLDYTNMTNGIPIPSFESYEGDFGINSKYLNEKHKIYVLESKSGEFMKKEFLTRNNKLPTKWKNGFSRGIATNKKQRELIYWTCVW